MDNQNTVIILISLILAFVLILVLMDNQNTTCVAFLVGGALS